MKILRLAAPARELESELGIPTSPLALAPSVDRLDPATVSALAGSGVRVVGILEPDERPIRRLEPSGGPTLPLISTPAIGDPSAVGFGAPVAQMVTRIETWLTTTAALEATGSEAHAVLVVGNDPADAPAFLAAARSWNGRFAAPRIVIGADPDPFLTAVVRGSSVQVDDGGRGGVDDPHSLAELLEMRAARERMSHDRAAGIYAPLVSILGGAPGDLEALVRGVSPQFAGTVVLNTSPLTRTDVIQLADGRTEIVTDIPGLGYAFVISPAITDPAVHETTSHHRDIAGRDFKLALDSTTGAIARLSDAAGHQWVRHPSGGLNAMADAELDTLVTEPLPRVGTRVTAFRRLRRGGLLRSTYTVYDSLPWLDIENVLEGGGDAPVEYHFSFPFPDAAVSWQRPLGAEFRRAPVSEFEHLRWVRLEHGGRAVLFRGYYTPTVLVTQDGTLINVAPPGVARFRVHLDGDRSMSPWRFGWHAEPLLAIPARPGGTGLLPSVGSLFTIDHEDIAVLGVKLADDGDGVIVFLQEHLGESRLISLQPGLVRFQEAKRVDFVERDRGSVDGTLDEGVLVRMPAHGIVALRLRGLWLAGA